MVGARLGIFGDAAVVAAAENRRTVRSALPDGAVRHVEELARDELFRVGCGGSLRRGNIAAPAEILVALGKLGKIVDAFVPFKIDSRALALGAEPEHKRILHRKDELVPALDVLDLDFLGQTEIEEAVHGIHGVRAPVAKASAAEVVP